MAKNIIIAFLILILILILFAIPRIEITTTIFAERKLCFDAGGSIVYVTNEYGLISLRCSKPSITIWEIPL